MNKKAGVGFSVNIILLGLVSLLNDLSSEMILPILPLFLTSLGSNGAVIGLIGGLMAGFPELLKAFSGFYSDKIRSRKKFVFFGYLNSQVFKLLLFFSKTWTSVLVFTTLDKLGKGIRDAPRDALISESMPHNKGKAFGIQRAFDSSGAVLGSLVVLGLFLFLGEEINFRMIILIAGVVGLTCLIPIYFVKDIKHQSIKKEKISFVLGFRSMSPKLKAFLFIAGLFALANFSYMFFVLKSMDTFSNMSNKMVIPIMLYVFFNFIYAVFAIPFGKLSDKIGRRKVIVAGYLLFGLVCLGFLFFSSLLAYIILFILYGLVYAMVVGNQRAFVSDNSPSRYRATALGIFQTIMGLCSIFAGVIAGLLFDINSNWVFIYGAVLSLLSFILFKSHKAK